MFIAAVAGSTFTSFLVQPADAGRKGLGTAGSLVEERGGSTTKPPCMGFAYIYRKNKSHMGCAHGKLMGSVWRRVRKCVSY